MSIELDIVVWQTLSGHHADFSIGNERARRYDHGFTPIAGFQNQKKPDLDELQRYCEPGENLFVAGWSGDPPTSWNINFEVIMNRMVWAGPPPRYAAGVEAAIPLQMHHAEQALELATLTNPGPFGIRTIELGSYVGIFEGDKLIAMAGERLHAGNFKEVSGICTHPDYRGNGLAKKLTQKVIQQQMSRGETPFLHVMQTNREALELYTQMGFELYCESFLRTISLN